jgi:acyl carrier protein
MYDYAELYSFLAQQLRVDAATLGPDDDLVGDLGVDGDDFFELEQAFEQRFSVDMSAYRWYFHHHDEGWLSTPAGLFFRRPKDRIAVTPRMLLESANAGRWIVEYPPHKGPPRTLHLNAIGCALLMLIMGLFPPVLMRLLTLFSRLVHHAR